MNFFNFFYVYRNTGFEKNRGYIRETFSSITQKILLYDMEYCYKNVFEIRTVTFVSQNFQKKFQRKKIKKLVWILKNQ